MGKYAKWCKRAYIEISNMTDEFLIIRQGGIVHHIKEGNQWKDDKLIL